jgi:predicted nucleic acid-binding OB-fold protein
MSGMNRDRQTKVPSRKSKTGSEPKTSISRPAEGRSVIPPTSKEKPVQAKKDAPRKDSRSNRQHSGRGDIRGGGHQGAKNQKRPNQRGDNRGGGRQGGRNQDSRNTSQRPSPIEDESWARVIEHDTIDDIITAITEGKLFMCRLSAKKGIEALNPTDRIYIGLDQSKKVHVDAFVGGAKLDLMSSYARQDMPLVVQLFVEDNSQHFIEAFFNVAGNLSLKQHAFELLPGVGNKKAMQIVKERRISSGFNSLEELNQSCNIDAAELLAKRFILEIEDRSIEPRLIDLLLPVKA